MITIEEQSIARRVYAQADFVVFRRGGKIAHIVADLGRRIPVCGRDMFTSGYSEIAQLPDAQFSACKVCWREIEKRLGK